MSESIKDFRLAAAEIRIPGSIWIDGSPTSAISGKTMEARSAVDGRLLGMIPACDGADVDLAVGAARRSFEGGAWSNMPPLARKRALLRFADAIEARSDDLALLDTLDMGKPITASRTVDMPAAIECIRWCAEMTDKLHGLTLPVAGDNVATVAREPLGVIGVVLPWNFPMMMAAWKLGPALAMGNSVVLKPAEQSSLSAMLLAQIATEAGIPDGVFNVVTGLGEVVGKAMGLHPDIDAIAFTGSTQIGKAFMHYAADSNMKRVSLECGGKSAAIILPDADLDMAVETAAWAVFFNQGECCDALSRLLVPRSLRADVEARLRAVASQVSVGNPLDSATEMGPIVDAAQYGRICDYLGIAEKEGARLVYGGADERGDGAHYVMPSIVSDVGNGMRIAREEVFGPVISMIEYDDEDDAIRIANDSPYGLVAAVFTQNLSTAHRVSKRLRVGAVWVNCFDAGDMTTPHGGYKESGHGRDRSVLCFDKYCEMKTTWIKL